MKSNTALKEYTMEEVARHTDPTKSVWVVISGFVVDVTKFIPIHPGGEEILVRNAGRDVTKDFMDFHSLSAKNLYKKYVIGKVAKK